MSPKTIIADRCRRRGVHLSGHHVYNQREGRRLSNRSSMMTRNRNQSGGIP